MCDSKSHIGEEVPPQVIRHMVARQPVPIKNKLCKVQYFEQKLSHYDHMNCFDTCIIYVVSVATVDIGIESGQYITRG